MGFVATSTDGGTSWTRPFVGPSYPENWNDDTGENLGATNARIVEAAASGMTVYAIGYEDWYSAASKSWVRRGIALKSSDGGSTWPEASLKTLAPQTDPPFVVPNGVTGFHFTSITAASPTVAYAAGNFGWVIKTTDGGANWGRTSTIPPGSVAISSIVALDANTVLAVGDKGRVVRSTDGGTSWSVQAPTAKDLRKIVRLPGSSTLIAVGDDEVILRSTNAGASWSTVSGGVNRPAISVAAPLGNFAVSGGSPITVSGTASDVGVGVASVEISIRGADGRFFDGSQWVTGGERWLTASTTNGWMNWSRVLTPDAATAATGQSWIRVRALDGLGNVSEVKEIASSNTRRSTGFTSLAYRGTPAYNQASYLSGVLISDTARLGGHSVTLQRMSDRTSGSWVNVTSKPTDSTGYVKFDIPASASGYDYTKTIYRLAYNGAAGYSPSQSANRTVHPKVLLGKPRKSAKTIRAKKTYTWYSSIKPRHAVGSKSVKLEFQRYVKGKPRAYKTVSATAYDSYSRVKLKIKLPSKGAWRVRAVHSDAGHAKSTSAWYKFTVK